MKRLSNKEVREALDRIYAKESSKLDIELTQMQSTSIPKDDWQYVDEARYEFTRKQGRDEDE